MFALADCNNFFASCEMLFNPKLEQKALVILSNNDGIIISRSQKAKDLGIKMGDPAYLYKDRKDIVLLSSNFALYSDMSNRVMQILSSFSPDMEIYSVDEAFFTLEDQSNLFEKAHHIRNTVQKWVGIPISIGIGKTKTLAKLASEKAKKQGGVFILEKIEETLKETALDEIWGIGSKLATRLKQMGIYTALQLIQADDSWLKSELGVVCFRTILELRAINCFELSDTPDKKKSIVCSRSFGQKISDRKILEEALSSFTAHAAEKLRDQNSNCCFLSIFLSTKSDYNSCHISLSNPTSYTPDLLSFMKEALYRIYKPSLEYKRAGVMLGDFQDSDAVQTDLLTPSCQSEKKIAAMQVLDQINARYEKPALRFAAEGIEKPWKSKKSNTTARFTTCWDELLKIP